MASGSTVVALLFCRSGMMAEVFPALSSLIVKGVRKPKLIKAIW